MWYKNYILPGDFWHHGWEILFLTSDIKYSKKKKKESHASDWNKFELFVMIGREKKKRLVDSSKGYLPRSSRWDYADTVQGSWATAACTSSGRSRWICASSRSRISSPPGIARHLASSWSTAARPSAPALPSSCSRNRSRTSTDWTPSTLASLSLVLSLKSSLF